MKIELTEQQKIIVNSLRLKSSDADLNMLSELQERRVAMCDVESLCTLINYEFIMEGIRPSFEPNAYGLQLEALLDIANRVRLKA